MKRTLLPLFILLVSCEGVFTLSNDSSNVGGYSGPGAGYVYQTNPAVAINQSYGEPDFKSFRTTAFITNDSSLISPCAFSNVFSEASALGDCFRVIGQKSSIAAPLTKGSEDWRFSSASDSFYQVNAFYHSKKITDQFLSTWAKAHEMVFLKNVSLLPASKFDIAFERSFWHTVGSSNITIDVVANEQMEEFSAYYSPSENEIVLGYQSDRPFFKFVQDPSVIYHEFGHLFVDILYNQKNQGVFNPQVDYRMDFGHIGDEASAINEGIADFFSYFINKRTHLGEWALGTLNPNLGSNYINKSRPMTINDPLHSLSFTSTQKYMYPYHIFHDPNDPTSVTKDIHVTGMVVSHYLVDLHKTLQSACTYTKDSHQMANELVLLLLSETLSELGDLSSKRSDYLRSEASNFVNFNPDAAYEWSQSEHQINFRRFFQVFGKNILHHISSLNDLDVDCTAFNQDVSEQLLDHYGLLLFDHYEDNGPSYDETSLSLKNPDSNQDPNFPLADILPTNGSISASPTGTTINIANRTNSILISKNQIGIVEESSGLSGGYLNDNPTTIANFINSLRFKGAPLNLSAGLSGTQYNNDNEKFSPGEIVAFSPNIKNFSNSMMAGVQVLGTDFDHMKLEDPTKPYVNRLENQMNSSTYSNISNHRPCIIDGWPLVSEGGVTDNGSSAGDCGYTTQSYQKISDNGSGYVYDADAPQPICLVQVSQDDEQIWSHQDHLRQIAGIEDKDCLGHQNGSDDFNPNECFFRVVPGANQANYTRIDPGLTYIQTLLQSEPDNTTEIDNTESFMLFEISKETPPGTKFRCRFRTRLSNCSDCYTDENGDPYSENEYAGHKPFKVIQFEFTVAD